MYQFYNYLSFPLLLVMLITLIGCKSKTSEDTSKVDSSSSGDSHWITRTDEELDKALTDICKESISSKAPILLEFSAPWCKDCKELKKLSEDSALKSELNNWKHLIVDVGKINRHQSILNHFKIDRIAYWVALRSQDCSKPVTQWELISSQAVEPLTGSSGPRTEKDLIEWLRAARG